jgi:hypothetical protein
MNWPVLLLALGAALALRLGFLALHLPNMESLWYDYERSGFQYRLAQCIDLLTILGFGACAVYALWTLKDAATSVGGRYGAAFVAWFGMALLERLAVHRFPRTNSPQLFLDARVRLVTNVALAVLAGLAMTGVTAIYFWFKVEPLK